MGQDLPPDLPAEGDGFRAFAELTPDFVAVLDPNGSAKYVNAAVSGIIGFSSEEVTGRALSEFAHAEDRQKVKNMIAGAADGEALVRGEIRFLHKDGTLRVLEALARGYAESTGKRGVVISARDVTGRVEEARRLREALEEVDDLYNNAPCGYDSLDADGVVVRINDTELNWVGRRREEVLGRVHFAELLTPESRAVFERMFPVLKAAGRIAEVEYALARRDGTAMPVLVSATAIRDDQGGFRMSRSTLYNITERKKTDARLQRVNRALRVISGTNAAIIRARVESSLYEAICRVCVEQGGYRLAWVGFAMPDEARSVCPVAQAGVDAGYLERANVTWGTDESGNSPTGAAIRTGQLQVEQNLPSNSRTAPWREEALRRGYKASLALPLNGATGTFGALTVYAAEEDAFDTEELHLMSELADDLAHGVASLREHVQRKAAEARLKHLAYFDELTGLPNRNRLMEAIEEVGWRPEGAGFPLLTFNVIRFSDIVGGIGVRAADELLTQIADRLRGALHERELPVRIGGDEFAVLLNGGGLPEAEACAKRIETALRRPFHGGGIPIGVQIRFGVAVAPEHGTEPEALILHSGLAVREARRSGRTFEVYGGPTEAESPRHLALIADLGAAIENRQFELMFQPNVDLSPVRVAGVEALVRWRHPERGVVSPREFIGLAEQTGLIEPLTIQVLDSALQQCRAWIVEGRAIKVAVNVSARSFYNAGFRARLTGLLRKWEADPGLLELEITESVLMERPAEVEAVLEELQDEGIRVSVDDFGVGYSSLSYLSHLPIHALKLDRSFVSQILEQVRTRHVVESTVSLAKGLGIRFIAEGVETREQVHALRAMGCHEFQGFFFSPPIPAKAVPRWVDDFSPEAHGIDAESVCQ